MSTATAGTTMPSARPRRRVLLALLAVSAVLNLFFVAGAAWTRMHAPPAAPSLEQRLENMAGELDLDPGQRVGFDRYVAAMRARSDKMHQKIAPLIAAAWDEIAKPQADSAQVVRLFDEAAETRRGFQREATVQTLDFLSILSPAQRAKFVAIAHAYRAPWLRQR